VNEAGANLRTIVLRLVITSMLTTACVDTSFDLRLERRLKARTFEEIRADSVLLAAAAAYGAAIYRRTCAACHGQSGEGNPVWCPALNDDEWIWGGADEQIFHTISFGVRQLTAPSSRRNPEGVAMRGTRNSIMPRFDRVLSDSAIAEVASYVRSLAAGRAASRGRQVYVEACAGCHGSSADGNQQLGAPRLHDHTWINPGNPARLEDYISIIGYQSTSHEFGTTPAGFHFNGMPNWAMPPLGLREGQIKSLVLFIKTLRPIRYAGIDSTSGSQPRIISANGRAVVLQPREGQVGFGQFRIASDRQSAGWVALYSNCCTTYPIPKKLVILRNGREVAVEPELPIWDWNFADDSRRVALRTGPIHGSVSELELYDLKSGLVISRYNGPQRRLKNPTP